MDLNVIHSPSSKFISQSLAQLMNLPNLELIDLISKLTPLNPKQVTNLHDLADRIKALPPLAQEVKQNIEHLINNLIFKQFPNPELDSIREIISNALDAQVRAKNEEEPIEITLDNDQLTVCDHGDGMNSGSLINYLVQGQTSNISQYLINAENHTAKVTGRFGQGGISVFYYLLYSSLPEPLERPEILYEDNKSTLKIPYFCNNKLYEATFTYTSGDENVKIETRIAATPKKISIKTRSEKEALKIKFFEKEGKINLNVYSVDPTSLNKGTCFKIVSPLIQKAAKKLFDSLKENFEFVSSTPIQLNDNLINNYKQISAKGTVSPSTTQEIPAKNNEAEKNASTPQEIPEKKSEVEKNVSSSPTTNSDLKIFTLKKGSIKYSPLTAFNRKGKLSLCEEGKTIITFKLENSLVPEKIALNFNYLPLTQDRASINFEDPAAQEFITQSIQEILSSSLPSKEKSALLNAFYPILKPECFNLLPFMLNRTENYYDMQLLPDLAEFENLVLEDTLWLNPDYLKFVTANKFYESGSCNFYKIKQPLPSPIIYSKFGGKTHFFVDYRLCDSKNAQHAYFNLTLMNWWLNQKGFGVQIPVKRVLGIKSSKKENKKSQSPEEIIKYTEDQDANEEIDIQATAHFLSNMENIFSKDIQKEAVEAVEKFFVNYTEKISKKYIKHLFHLMCTYEEARKYILKDSNGFYIPGYFTLPLEAATPFILHPILYLSKHPDENRLYSIFFRNFDLSYYSGLNEVLSLSHEPFHEVYCKWHNVIKASGCKDYALIIKSVIPSMKIHELDNLHLLINKLNENKEAVLALWNYLEDLSYLVTLPACKIDRIIKTIAYMHEKKFIITYTQAHYDKIASLLDLLPEKLDKKSAWILVYFGIAYPIHNWRYLELNLDSFQTEFLALASESKDHDIENELIATVSRINDFKKFETELNSKISSNVTKSGIDFTKENLPVFLEKLKEGNLVPANWPISLEQFLLGLWGYYPFQLNLQNNLSRENLIAARENHLERLENSQCILPSARALIYSPCIGGGCGILLKGLCMA